jgi:acyl carrier protein
MQRPQLIKLFRDLASEIAEKDLSFLQEESSISDMGIDSLAMLELVGTMERELRIRVPDEKLVGLITVRQLLELVEGRITQAA